MVVANAPWTWAQAHIACLAAADLIVAADGGANHLARIGLRPAIVVGDLDSITPSVRRWVGEDRLLHRPDQDSTDLHKTLAYCFQDRAAQAVTVLAATAGRLDHTLENLGLLARWSRHGGLAFLTGDQRIVAVHDTLEAATEPGDRVSLLPLGSCPRVWTEGLSWQLEGEPLDLLDRTSVSNRATGSSITVRVAGGIILAFLPARPGGC